MQLPNSMPEIMDVWGAKLPSRLKYSPLFFCGYTEMGALNRLIHIWAYEDMKQRSEIRAAAVAAGDWPPATGKFLVTMNNKIMVPSSFLACSLDSKSIGGNHDLRVSYLHP